MNASRPIPHPQLEALAQELDAATTDARALASQTDETLHRRPRPESWSAAECLVHLTLTTKELLPRIDSASAEATAGRRDDSRKYRRDVMGWFLSRALEPPIKRRFKTTPPFIPQAAAGKDSLISDFARFQQELIGRLGRLAGANLNGVKVTSPFSSRVRYNLYSAFRITTAHERRHLEQARLALRGL
jgi:hypothetical protein